MTPSSKCQRIHAKGLIAALAFVTAILYLPTLSADFAWDSQIQVRCDPFLHNLTNLPAVLSLRVLSMDVLDFNRPTQLLSLMLDSLIWGKHPFGYHLTNLILHVGVTVLLFLFLRRLTPLSCAFAAALVYGVHPVNCEAVAEVGNREDLLATFFLLGGLMIASKWGPKWQSGCACVACFFIAIGAKESAVVGPVLLTLYWWCFRRSESRRDWTILIGCTALVVGLFLLARFVLEDQDSVIFASKPSRLGGSWPEMLRLQPRIWFLYHKQIVWPSGLCADYGLYSVRHYGLTLSLVTLIVVLIAQGWWGKRDRVFAFGAAVFWISLLPVSNFVPLFQAAADRFLYLPLVGVALMAAALTARVRQGPLFLSLLAIPLAFVTWQQEKVWRNDLSLWLDVVEKNPRSSVAYNNLGSAYIAAHKPQEALQALRQSLAVTKGKSADTWAQIAVLLNDAGRTADANDAFHKAVALDPRFADPDLMLKSLMWEPQRVDKWRVIAARNRVASPS